jgi:DNA-binding GntR family transcriptional regulator
VIESIKAQMDRIRYLSFDGATPLPLIIEQHTRIVDAIETANPTESAAAMRTHLREIIVSLPEIAARFPDDFE